MRNGETILQVNPMKDTVITFEEGDYVIVVAKD